MEVVVEEDWDFFMGGGEVEVAVSVRDTAAVIVVTVDVSPTRLCALILFLLLTRLSTKSALESLCERRPLLLPPPPPLLWEIPEVFFSGACRCTGGGEPGSDSPPPPSSSSSSTTGLGTLIATGSDLLSTRHTPELSSSAFVTLTSFSASSASLRLRPASILTADCECGSVLGGGGCSMVTTTVGEGSGAVTALSRTTFVVVVVVLLPGTFPFSSVTVDFFTLMVIVLMFMAPEAGLIGLVEDLDAGRDGVLPDTDGTPPLFLLPGRCCG